jgi:hypothetical protein
MAGYLHPKYVESMAEFGKPHPLPGCGGYLLARTIPHTEHLDAMGCYPLFCCQDWAKLQGDLEVLRGQMVSVALVTDPFGEFQVEQLQDYFPDRMIHYKDHLVVDFTGDRPISFSGNHKRNIKKALRGVAVEFCARLETALDDWTLLYKNLIRRHSIKGIAAFSRWSFEELFKVPGLLAFRAVHGAETVGMTLVIIQGKWSYSHLSAYSERGYELRASYALFNAAIEHLKSMDISGLSLGSAAGVQTKVQDGLTEFKRGWANASKPVYFCGRILDPSRYEQIVKANPIPPTDYFPAYRLGEF